MSRNKMIWLWTGMAVILGVGILDGTVVHRGALSGKAIAILAAYTFVVGCLAMWIIPKWEASDRRRAARREENHRAGSLG